MISYNDIAALRAEGATAEQILAALQADTRHKRDVPATGAAKGDVDLLYLLCADFQVLRLAIDATWKGPIVDYFNQDLPDAGFQQLKAGFELLLTQLQISGRQVYCGSHAHTGALTSGITQVIGALVDSDPNNSHTSASVAAAMDDFTGGVRYAGVTLSDVESVIAEHDLAETKRQLEDAAMDALQVFREALSAWDGTGDPPVLGE